MTGMFRFIIWVIGFDPRKDKAQTENKSCISFPTPKPIFEYTPVGDWYGITIFVPKATNVIHRALQRICFGVKYRMTK